MKDTGTQEQNLDFAKNLQAILVDLAKNPVSIPILIVLIETVQGSKWTLEEIMKKIHEKFGDRSFSRSEILNGLYLLTDFLGMIEKVSPFSAENIFNTPYSYTLTEFGRVAGNFFKKILYLKKVGRY